MEWLLHWVRHQRCNRPCPATPVYRPSTRKILKTKPNATLHTLSHLLASYELSSYSPNRSVTNPSALSQQGLEANPKPASSSRDANAGKVLIIHPTCQKTSSVINDPNIRRVNDVILLVESKEKARNVLLSSSLSAVSSNVILKYTGRQIKLLV